MSSLLDVAKKIEKQLSAPMGDGGVYLETLEELRVAIREETTGTDAAIQALLLDRSSGLLRAMIETDGHVRAGEHLAALGAAAASEHNIRQLVELLTAIRDIQAAKKKGQSGMRTRIKYVEIVDRCSVRRTSSPRTEKGLNRDMTAETETKKTLDEADLANFTWLREFGTSTVFGRTLFTDGVKYVADTAGAYWLIDEIAINQTRPKVRTEEFRCWTLSVDLEKHKAVLICDDGNRNVVFTKRIEYTDFPLPEIKLYCTDGTILLLNQY